MTPRREPALLWLGLFASIVQMVSAFVLPLSETQQGVLNAFAVAIAGVITALSVKSDQLAPAILGALQALLAVGLAFGLHLTPENQGVIMAFTTSVVSMFVRQIVTAPTPARVAFPRT